MASLLQLCMQSDECMQLWCSIVSESWFGLL
jgi:hypothetical protein